MSSSKMAMGPTIGECVFRKLPNFYSTTIKLSTLLDVAKPLGNDYRAVLELLGFKPEEVQFWGDRCMRPTLEALRVWDGTVQELASALWECQRPDALSELIAALVEALREAHKSSVHPGTNILTQDLFSTAAASVLQPMPVQWDELGPCLTADRRGDFSDDATSVMSTQTTKQFNSQAAAKGLSLTSCDDAMGVLARRPVQLERILTQHFLIPTQIALTCLSPSSHGRRTTEFVCNCVAVLASRCRCISNAGDITWISNTTVYINNFARVFLLLMTSLNVATCVFGEHHTPVYILELIIAAVPVAQSLYIEQNLPLYRDFVKKIKEVEAGMLLIRKTLEQGIGKSVTSESNNLRELDVRKSKLNRLKLEVLPVYSDIRLCIISTMVIEMLLVFLVLSVGLLYNSGEELLERFHDGFTTLALVLMCVDCTYNFAIVAVYYHDRTIETVLQKDRFRMNASLFLQSSDSV